VRRCNVVCPVFDIGPGALPALDDGEGRAGYGSRGRFLNERTFIANLVFFYVVAVATNFSRSVGDLRAFASTSESRSKSIARRFPQLQV